MPLTAQNLTTGLLSRISPGNTAKFYQMLTEADERLLNMGRWVWTRAVLTLPVVDGFVTLPAGYKSISGCRVGSVATGVLWQDIEYLEGGPGEINVEGCHGAQLLDQGLDDDGARIYKATATSMTEVTILARYDSVVITGPAGIPRCQNFAAIKQAMMAIVYEDRNDAERSQGYLSIAKKTLDDQELAYRGGAKKIFKPSMTQPLRRRSRTNFP